MTSLPTRSTRPLRAAIYCRVSTNSQEKDGTSLESQEAECREHATRLGCEVLEGHVYREVGSGFQIERRKLDDLRAAVRRRDVDVVIVHAFDRLSRNQAHTYILLDEADRAEARIESVTEVFEDTATGRFLRSTKAFVAEVWREQHRERTQRGLRARIASGKPLAGGKAIYGYRWRDEAKSGLEVYESEAATVRRIFRHIAGGGSAAKIVGTLNAEGVPSPQGKLWCCSTVGRMVRNDAYVGKAYAHKWDCQPTRSKASGRKYLNQKLKPESERAALPEGTFPAIVDAETSAKALAQLKVNRGSLAKVAINPEAFLVRGGIARCGVCGGALTGAHSKDRKGNTRTLYRCQAAYKDGGAKRHVAPQIEAPLLDKAVWDFVMLVRSDRDFIRQHLADQAADDVVGVDLDAVEQTLKSVARQETNLTHAISLVESPDAIAPLTAQLETLATTKRELLAQREAILERAATAERIRTSLATLDARIEHEQDALERLTYRERRDVLEALGVSVNLWPQGHAQRYEVTMSYDISAWLDPAFLVDQPEVEDDIDERTRAGLLPRPVYRGAPMAHAGTSTR